MNYKTLLVTKHDGYAVVQFNRPGVLNALNIELMEELVNALEAFDKEDDVRALIITGNEKAFAAGADIKEMSDASAVEMLLRDQFARWDRIRKIKKPIIAAVSGFALGGGCELSMSCDIIIASETAKFGQPEINIGVMPGAGGTQRLTRAVGKYKAMEMVLTGRMISADEAMRWGLVNKVVPVEYYLEEAKILAKEIASKPPVAVRLAKEAGATLARTVLMPGRRYEQFKTLAEFRESEKRALKSLQLAEPVVARNRFRLAVENHKDQLIPEKLETLKRVGSEWIGLCVDVANNFALMEDPLDTMRAFAPFALTVHIKDMVAQVYPDGWLLADVALEIIGVGYRAKAVHARKLDSGNCQPAIAGPGRNQELVVTESPAVIEVDDALTAYQAQQARRFNVELLQAQEVTGLHDEEESKYVTTADGNEYGARAVLIATGSKYRRLGVPGEDELIGAGIHFCATCDGPFYKEQPVAVVGGGNSAGEESLFLTRFANKVTILVRGPEMTASKIVIDKVTMNPKIEVRYNTQVKELLGEAKLSGVTILDTSNNSVEEIHPKGMFVFIGLQPNTGWLPPEIKRDKTGFIMTKSNLETDMPGVFAAGDCRLGSTKQAASAVGEGATAALMIREYLKSN